MIRQAKISDIEIIKKIAARYSSEIGFILRSALEDAVKRNELLFDEISGAFCHYHTRRDKTSVIYEICVPKFDRGKGLARQMINMLPRPVLLKCPVDNESNKFYEHMGFTLLRVDPGKKRQLNVWQLGGNGKPAENIEMEKTA
jgi:N-acetylglutamate synthase-like GNAT family acetyltransferase